jgi:PEP-CTERM motif
VASAGVVFYSSQSAFEAQGTISQTSNFDDLATGTNIAVPFPRGGVMYTNVDYVIDGPGAYGGVLDSVRQTLFNAQLSNITGNIDTSPATYSLFGFKTGYVTVDPLPVENVTLTTNLGSYLVSGLSVPKAGTSLGFVGFATTTPGEFFTGFAVSTTPANATNAPVMTDIELGNVTPVPEPASFALAAIGFVVAAGWRGLAPSAERAS